MDVSTALHIIAFSFSQGRGAKLTIFGYHKSTGVNY